MAQQVAFQRILEALLDNGTAFPARHLARFSDLSPGDLQALLKAWPAVSLERKRSLLKGLTERFEDDTLVSFDDLARALLDDPDEQVRLYAVRLLWENEDPRLVAPLLEMLERDSSEQTRAEAASVLGRYVYLGELDQLRRESLARVEDALLAAAARDDQPRVQRMALESLGYSSRPEVPALLQAAFKRKDPQWIASALFAMGRSTDQRWEEDVVSQLDSVDAQVRLAAVEAAGELGLPDARPILLAALSEEDDAEIYNAVIWSLSQIGGEDVRTYLENLLDSTDDDEQVGFIEDALENLTFTEGLDKFDLLAFDPDEPEE